MEGHGGEERVQRVGRCFGCSGCATGGGRLLLREAADIAWIVVPEAALERLSAAGLADCLNDHIG